MTPKVTVTFVVSLTEFITPKCHGVISSRRDQFMTPKVTVTFLVGMT